MQVSTEGKIMKKGKVLIKNLAKKKEEKTIKSKITRQRKEVERKLNKEIFSLTPINKSKKECNNLVEKVLIKKNKKANDKSKKEGQSIQSDRDDISLDSTNEITDDEATEHKNRKTTLTSKSAISKYI